MSSTLMINSDISTIFSHLFQHGTRLHFDFPPETRDLETLRPFHYDILVKAYHSNPTH